MNLNLSSCQIRDFSSFCMWSCSDGSLLASSTEIIIFFVEILILLPPGLCYARFSLLAKQHLQSEHMDLVDIPGGIMLWSYCVCSLQGTKSPRHLLHFISGFKCVENALALQKAIVGLIALHVFIVFVDSSGVFLP